MLKNVHRTLSCAPVETDRQRQRAMEGLVCSVQLHFLWRIKALNHFKTFSMLSRTLSFSPCQSSFSHPTLNASLELAVRPKEH